MPVESKTITIPEFRLHLMTVEIIGVTPLLMNQFGERAKANIARGETPSLPKGPKRDREPDAEFAESMYRFDDGRIGFPAIAFKKAMVSAGQRFTDEVGTRLMGVFSIELADDLVEVESPLPPRMRTDRAVLQGRTTTLAYRAEFYPWRCVLPITFNPDLVSQARLLNLINFAGQTVGVGAWRVEKKGNKGKFRFGAVQVREYAE